MMLVTVAVLLAGFAASSPSAAMGGSCPRGTLPLTRADLPEASRAVLAHLRRAYSHRPTQIRDARITARLAMDPRAGRRLMPRQQCGDRVWRRTTIVDVYLPNFQPRSASLSQLTFFVSRTTTRWIVWRRAH